MSELMHEVDVLEGKLQEASKQRESRLRKVRQSVSPLCRRQALDLIAGSSTNFDSSQRSASYAVRRMHRSHLLPVSGCDDYGGLAI